MKLTDEQRIAEGWLLNWMGDFDVVVPANAFDVLRDRLAAHPVADAAEPDKNEDDPELGPCQTTCGFYVRGRPCACAASRRATKGEAKQNSWQALFDRIALELNCLPSSFVDGNEHVFAAIAKLRGNAPEPTVADAAVSPNGDCDAAQLTDWLMTDPQTGEKLRFAGPLEPDFLRFSRVKLEGKSGAVWTLSARLEEGYLTAEERLENIKRAAREAEND